MIKSVKKCHWVLLYIFYFNLPRVFILFFCTHLLLYFKGISKKLNFALISNISTYFIHSNLPYVLFIWQSNNLYQKLLNIQRKFLENLPQIHKKYFYTGSIELLLLFKSTHSRQIWPSIDKYILG